MKKLLIKLLKRLLGKNIVVLRRDSIEYLSIQTTLTDLEIVRYPEHLVEMVKSKMLNRLAEKLYSDFVTIEKRDDVYGNRIYTAKVILISPKS